MKDPSCMLFCFNDTATTEIYTLSLHDALPISRPLLVHLMPKTLLQKPMAKNGKANGVGGVRTGRKADYAKAVGAPPAAEELNPFRIAQAQLDKAAAAMKLPAAMHQYLREPQRFLQVSIPVRMDDGTTQTFIGFRCQYNDARGPTDRNTTR